MSPRTVLTERTAEYRRQEYMDLIFDSIVSVNLNRLLGRLGSCHYACPLHERHRVPPLPLHVRLRQLVIQLKVGNNHTKAAKRAELLSEIEELGTKLNHLESMTQSEWQNQLKSMVMLAFHMSRGGLSFGIRLGEIGLAANLANNRAILDLTKVANYFKTCCDLVRMCRAYRRLCLNIILDILEPFEPLVQRGESRCVHAEVQLIVSIELRQPAGRATEGSGGRRGRLDRSFL